MEKNAVERYNIQAEQRQKARSRKEAGYFALLLLVMSLMLYFFQ